MTYIQNTKLIDAVKKYDLSRDNDISPILCSEEFKTKMERLIQRKQRNYNARILTMRLSAAVLVVALFASWMYLMIIQQNPDIDAFHPGSEDHIEHPAVVSTPDDIIDTLSELPPEWFGILTGKEMTLDDVRELSAIGNDLQLEDFLHYEGKNDLLIYPSHNDKYLVVFNVQGGHQLNVRARPDGKIDIVNFICLQQLSLEINIGVEIRSGDIDEYLQRYNTYDFLNSNDSFTFPAVSFEAAVAMIRADLTTLSSLVIDMEVLESTIPYLVDFYDEIEYMETTWNPENIISPTEIYASHKYLIKGEDSFGYVSMILVKIDDEWKVKEIYFEK